ncbi:glycosyltransferase family 2 protein [Clostridium estertheticum]|uniref:glycosyltransferase family 2 protein n=1 Tax=Clostridium estertheticum TaxID=238834 RepID=UPI001CF1B6BF|nr:glycosyltransferase family 2 protein [Clostridium estertheticum]MCB2306817.1 glycosyltransferase family 2 protein [Clostridium estertheticum]MCB2347028.1 glycosyltransferase family 2 protein [Clostridium estertheticum]MCB2350323.1 glycosyltransferase family 2 protein [Clostridium estertheticum]WAG47290.1 glycosyltransferase family 2 protein [Clostridium estertheticum]
MVKISIIVPIYNGAKYIKECLEMIMDQTFKDFELIIIDDGSTDNSKEMCEEYAKIDSRIKLISKKNGGTWAARNRGIDESIGKYIIFLDCDDWYENNLFEKMYESIKNNDVDLVISGQSNVFVDKNGEIIRKTTVLPKKHNFKTKDEILSNYILLREEEIGDTLWNKIYKSEIIKKYNLKFENYKRGEDTIFNANYYQHIDKCIVISEALYNYRIENTNPVWLKYCDNYLDIVRSENDTIVGKLKEWGKYSKDAREYQATHFTYRIIEYFYKIISSKSFFNLESKIDQKSTLKSKSQEILNLLDNEEVRSNLDDSKVIGKFHKLLIKSMKSRNIELILFLVKIKLVYNNIKGL